MITIRQATLTDLPQIIAMDQEVFGSYGAQEKPAVIRGRLEVFPAGCAVLETTEAQEFVGYLTTEKWEKVREPVLDEDPHQTHKPNGRILCVTTFCIGPKFQNQGLGPQLLDYTIELARSHKCREIVLETAHAQKFYARHGFETITQRTQRGIPLYVMRLQI